MVVSRWHSMFTMFVLLGLLYGCSQGMETKNITKGEWKRLEPLLKPRSGFSAITRGSRIYVIGGVDEKGFLKECEWTTIRADGTLEEWKPSSPLNIERAYAGVVAFNRYVYVIGGAGGRDGRPLDTVERAWIKPDGSLDEWVLEENRLTTPRFGAATIVSGGYVYAIGGYAENPLRTVERARINPDGSLGRWEPVGYIPKASYMLATVKHREHIYLIGGRTAEGASKDVFFTELEGDGSLKDWHTTEPLNTPRYGASAVVVADRIYVGGGTATDQTYTIEATHTGDDHSITGWKKVLELPVKAGDALITAHNDVIYLIGGVNDKEYLPYVYATRVY